MDSGFLFGMPYFKYKVDPSSYNKSELIDDIEKNYSMSPFRNKWGNLSNFHHSYDDENNQDFVTIDYDRLIPVYSEIIQDFVTNQLELSKAVSWRYTIDNYTCSKGGQSMNRHNHMPSMFSAIHYVKFNPEQHLGTTFYNGNSYSEYTNAIYFGQNIKQFSANARNFFETKTSNNSWLFEKWRFNVEEDDFIITPSLLSHAVEYSNPDPSMDCRITIALNILLEEVEER